MKRRQRLLKRAPSPVSSDDEPLIKKVVKGDTVQQKLGVAQTNNDREAESSSSESDIADYLQDPDKIDLNSSFFRGENKSPNSFVDIEKNIFDGITRLSESDSDDEDSATNNVQKIQQPLTCSEPTEESNQNETTASDTITKLNFQQLQNYTMQLEEAKKQVEKYKKQKEIAKRKKSTDHEKLDISDILSAERASLNTSSNAAVSSYHSSDFDSCSDSEKDWEEVAIHDSQDVKRKSDILKDGVQITIELPQTVRKSKKVDLLTAMKRRLNRMRKENQVYIHKVHLLCWIAHGNFVNAALNTEKILGLSLSILPSQNSYPSGRIDLGYLEQLLQWYKKSIVVVEKPVPKKSDLQHLLETQIQKKQAYNKKMLTYIFIALLRSLGIQCRLVLSFIVEPLRPPASEMHSLSTKQDNVKEDVKTNAPKKLNLIDENAVEQNTKTTSESKPQKTQSSNKEKQLTTKGKPSDKQPPKKLEAQKDKRTVDANRTRQKHNVATSKSNKEIHETKASSDAKSRKNTNSIKEKESVSKTNQVNKRPLAKLKAQEDEAVVESKKTKTNVGLERVTRGRPKTPVDSDINEHSIDAKCERSSTKNTAGQKKSKGRGRDTVSELIQPGTESSRRKGRSRGNNNVKQIDGLFDSESEISSCESSIEGDLYTPEYISFIYTHTVLNNRIPQCDGADDSKKDHNSKPNLKKIKQLSKDNKNEAKVPVGCGSNKQKQDDTIKSQKSKVNLTKIKQKSASPDDQSNDTSKLPRKKISSKVDSEDEFSTDMKHKLNSQKRNTKPSPSTSKGSCKYFSSPDNSIDIRNDIMQLVKGRISQEKENRRTKRVKNPKQKNMKDSDSDYDPAPRGNKHNDSEDEFVPKIKVKKRIAVRKSGDKLKVLSSDEEGDKSKKRKGVDVWAEVFLEDEEKWISVDVGRGEVHCVQQLYARATHPVAYIVAWNNDNSLKDVTSRYCNNFNTVTRKLRVENSWWQETLRPFIGKKTARDKEEDEELALQQLEKPLPTSIAEYKNHPLYVLRRHLLKFEGIYPSDAPTLGFVRGEPVYSRDCVYTLHSRDIWLKHAKVVKPGETPYKIVKARPKYDKLSNTVITDQMLEIFGPWQTEDYDPPTAENGIVPRNAYGNVELFKPCMLPKKTVHLKLPGLNRVAKKLDIDCAAAIVGFDFHSGWSHPTYDGFVVCEEYADQLVAAWELEQEEIEKREQEKIDKRVYDNWRRLIKGLLIRERLKAKYDFSAGPSKKQKNPKAPKLSVQKKSCVKKKRRISDSD